MTTYYVDINGNNGSNGSSDAPFRTIQSALNSGLNPGDEVVVRAGTYQESLNISSGGSATAQVTLRAEDPGTVLLRPPSGSWNAISVNADYVTVQGFDIANARGDGIEANNVHHINILDNISHGNGESGIQFNWSDFILVEGNTTYENASDGWFSGISIYQNRNITGDNSTEGFRTIVRNNVSYDNVTQTGQHTDGNGIIIDDFQSTQTSGFPNYTFKTLVENNLVYMNGGKGIQVTWSDSVTVRGNTAYHNNQDPLNFGTWRGEISNSQSTNNVFVNNIAVADPSVNRNNTALDNTSYGGYRNDVEWVNNLTFNGTLGQASVRTDGNNAMPSAADGNILGVNPQFVNGTGGADSDFRLSANSPAVDAGTGQFGLWQFDLDMTDRTAGPVDLGAYERNSGDTPLPPPPNTNPAAVDDTGLSTTSDTNLRIQMSRLLQNDGDADGDTLNVISVGNAIGGDVRVSGNEVIFDPDAGYSGQARFNYTVSDGEGGTDSASVSISVTTPDGPNPPTLPVTPSTIDFSFWDGAITPQVVMTSDTGAVALGMRFTADVDADLEGLMIYRGDGATGLSSISLWSNNGNRVATASASETAAGGWQEVLFDSSVELEAGQTYVASYHTQSGNYAFESNFFNTARDAGPISFSANAGVYSYDGSASFPDKVYQASNYFIDPLVSVTSVDEPDPDPDGPSTNTVIGEAGVASGRQVSADAWMQVSFSTTLDDPSVVMGGFTDNGSQAYTVRVRNVTDNGFEYQLDEWDYLDGSHVSESISWLAIERGTHRLEDGRTIEAGSTTASDSWTDVSFDGAFGAGPVVLAQAHGQANTQALTDRIRSVESDGFQVRLLDEQASSQSVLVQDIDWVAISQGGSASDGAVSDWLERAVDHDGFDFDFNGSFEDTDFALVTDMQSEFGSDPATLRTVSVTRDGAVVSVLEEQSQDAETAHLKESFGYAAFETGVIDGLTLDYFLA